uniref:Uncharacterized protein n=1 Tax=Triticum urartu TaxID=4572 RepID=A0A8R7TMS3_TRIUA
MAPQILPMCVRAHAVPRVGSRVLHIPVLFMLQLWGSFHVHTTYWTLQDPLGILLLEKKLHSRIIFLFLKQDFYCTSLLKQDSVFHFLKLKSCCAKLKIKISVYMSWIPS